MFMLKYIHGYHRSTKINRYEYLTHEWFSHGNFPIYGNNNNYNSLGSYVVKLTCRTEVDNCMKYKN